MISSAAAGIPFRPRRVDTSPSCMTPPDARVVSSQWSATGISKVRAYSSAVRMRWLDTTGRPSSDTATAPAPTISPNSESRSPRCPKAAGVASLRPPLGRVGELGAPTGEEIEHRHADRDPVRHLVEDHAVRSVGDAGVDLDAAIHGPRMHDGQGARRFLEPLERDAEHPVILPQARDEAHLHALELQPEHVQHVCPLDRLLDPAEAAHAQLFDAPGHERIGTAHGNLGAELREAPDVRARDAGVQHVAHETHLETGDLAVLVADREQVEQRLGGVLVLAVARADDVGADAVAEERGGAGRRMTDDHHIDPHRFEVAGRIDQRLAFLDRAAAGHHVDRVRREAFFGELERDAGTGRGFEEQVDDRLAAQRRHLLDGPLGDLFERLGGVEDQADLIGREALEPDQVLSQGGGHVLLTRSTSSLPSSSSTSTSTRWPSLTSTLAPTTSGWIGNSRPPHAEAPATKRGRPG